VKSGQERIAAAPPPGISPEDAAREVPSLRDVQGPATGEEIAD
jgi:isoquinoline 1-oxidoreductase subunit alpha